MTPTNAAGTVGSGETPDSVGSKSVLVCPRCGHESALPGDWILVVEETAVDVHCPDCWWGLTTRPR
jgi:predicted RNA-binding Zn-ribbon protein involved in translation (DUF1610 family)